MPHAHVYLRVQVSGTDAQIGAITDAVTVLCEAVEAAGGEWYGHGDVRVEPDAVVSAPVVAVPVPSVKVTPGKKAAAAAVKKR
jgi:hypothetical protein